MANSIARFETYNEADDVEKYFERFEVHKVAHLFSGGFGSCIIR